MTNSEQPHTQSPIRKALRLAAKGLGACLLILLILTLWNLVMGNWQHRRNPVPADFYAVNGLRMHIDCRGVGSPVVVMEAAASAPWSSWRKVHPQLSQTTRVCSYDRAGHGWSEPRYGSRDAETIVRELHSLLDKAGVKRPFIMAGHSAGGLYVREYGREFPTELVGVVLVDSSSPQQLEEEPGLRERLRKTSATPSVSFGRTDCSFGRDGNG